MMILILNKTQKKKLVFLSLSVYKRNSFSWFFLKNINWRALSNLSHSDDALPQAQPFQQCHKKNSLLFVCVNHNSPINQFLFYIFLRFIATSPSSTEKWEISTKIIFFFVLFLRLRVCVCACVCLSHLCVKTTNNMCDIFYLLFHDGQFPPLLLFCPSLFISL